VQWIGVNKNVYSWINLIFVGAFHSNATLPILGLSSSLPVGWSVRQKKCKQTRLCWSGVTDAEL